MKNKPESYKHFPLTPPFFPGSPLSPMFSFSFPSGTGGQEMGAAVSSSHFFSAAPSEEEEGLLMLFSCSSVGSLPLEAIFHKLLERESFPQAAVHHEQLQHASLSTGHSPSGTNRCSVGSPWGHKFCQQACCSSSLHGATVPPGVFPRGHSFL